MMAVEAVILIGAQASGKSTFYRERFFRTHVRISLDLLRTRHRESLLLNACLEMKQGFVVDNTNPTFEDRARYLGPAREAGFRAVGYYFQSAVDDCLRRNANRRGEERVPERGVRGTHAKLQLPTWREGFDELHYVSISTDGDFAVSEWRADEG